MFFLLILLNCTNTNVRSDLSSENLEVNLSSVNNEELTLLFENRVKFNTITQGRIISQNPATIEKVVSLANNIVSFNENEISFHSSDSYADILEVTFRQQTLKQERIEVRICRKVDVCLGIYAAADNDLNGGIQGYSQYRDFLKKDLDELLSTDIPDNVGVIILIDRRAKTDEYYKSSFFDSEGLYIIENHKIIKIMDEDTMLKRLQIEEVSIETQNTNENFKNDLHMGHILTFTFFLDAMNDFFEADRYALDMWSHGFSIFGVGFDSSTGHNALRAEELREGIIQSKLGHLDVMLFSACLLMDIGILGVLGNLVNASIGSSDFVPGDGSFYGNHREDGVIKVLANNKGTPFEIAKALCDINFDSFTTGAQANSYVLRYLTYSAVDHSKLENIINSMSTLFSSNLTIKGNALPQDFQSNLVFYGADYDINAEKGDLIDLGSLAYNLSKIEQNENREKALALLEAISNARYARHIRSEAKYDESFLGIGALYPYYRGENFKNEMITNQAYITSKWNNFMVVE